MNMNQMKNDLAGSGGFTLHSDEPADKQQFTALFLFSSSCGNDNSMVDTLLLPPLDNIFNLQLLAFFLHVSPTVAMVFVTAAAFVW